MKIELHENDVRTLIEVLDCWAEALEPQGECVTDNIEKLNKLEAKLRAALKSNQT